MTVYTDALTLAHHHDHHQVTIVNHGASLHLGIMEILDPQGQPLSPTRLSALPGEPRSRVVEQLAVIGSMHVEHLLDETW